MNREIAADNGKFTEYIKIIKSLQTSFETLVSDIAKEEHSNRKLLNTFLIIEENTPKIPTNIQIDRLKKKISGLKTIDF